MRFESLVNTEGFQTYVEISKSLARLRVLLIQKDFKRKEGGRICQERLRVLLIQKDFKLGEKGSFCHMGLRVLLI